MGSRRIVEIGRYVLLVAIIGGFYFLTGKLGLHFALVHPSITAIWAPSGIALAAFLLFGNKIWPGVYLGALFVNFATSGAIFPSLGIALGNTLEGLVGCYLIRKYSTVPKLFERSTNIFTFTIMGAMCSTMVGATIGVMTLILSGLADWSDFQLFWYSWWLGDGIGVLVVTPILLLWSSHPFSNWKKREGIEAGLILMLLILVGQAVFGHWFSLGFLNYPVAFLCAPILIGASFRFHQREIASFNFVLTCLAVAGTLHGYGPFIRPTKLETILLLQVFIGITTIMCMVVSALTSERRKLILELREMLAHVKTLAGLLPICSWCKKIRNDQGYWQEVEAYIHERSDVDFSHGICPDCLIKYKAEVLEHRRNKRHNDGLSSSRSGMTKG
ncbi:MAG TPA: MASE1 domain-containing protein [Bacteroidota bacterium]|nr:MASE1 domain-containing protein [Bacteroidota bacterium]